MVKLGFDTRWVSLIMHCITSVTYSVKFNDDYNEVFTPGKGL